MKQAIRTFIGKADKKRQLELEALLAEIAQDLGGNSHITFGEVSLGPRLSRPRERDQGAPVRESERLACGVAVSREAPQLTAGTATDPERKREQRGGLDMERMRAPDLVRNRRWNVVVCPKHERGVLRVGREVQPVQQAIRAEVLQDLAGDMCVRVEPVLPPVAAG